MVHKIKGYIGALLEIFLFFTLSNLLKNINCIKIEAELSLEKLNNIPKNSKEEMDIYVGNYNSNL